MPELPEVETLRRSLSPLLGRTIIAARLRRKDVCTTHDHRRATPEALLQGAAIVELARHGKQLALIGDDGRTLVVHLGMTGQLRLLAAGNRPAQRDHIHADWSLDDGSTLRFRDPRRFGGLWTLPSRAVLEERWSALGPDGLLIDGPRLHAAAGESNRAIKAALLDQAVVAGVGNIYADEALFRAAIRPTRRATRVSKDDYARLADQIRATLAAAIDARGSSLRDYIDADGLSGSAQLTHAVYGRGGMPCISCSRTLRRITTAQRTTVYCASCQS